MAFVKMNARSARRGCKIGSPDASADPFQSMVRIRSVPRRGGNRAAMGHVHSYLIEIYRNWSRERGSGDHCRGGSRRGTEVWAVHQEASSWPHESRSQPPAHLASIHTRLYLGRSKDAKDQELLQSLGVNQVLDVTSKGFEEALLTSQVEQMGVFTKRVPAKDEEEVDFKDFLLWLSIGTCVLDAALSSNKTVLLHCYKGCNRSVALAVAYACHYQDMSFHQALSEVRRAHWDPCATLTNGTFADNLRFYDGLFARKRLSGGTSEDLPARPHLPLPSMISSRFSCFRVLRPEELRQLPQKGIVARCPHSKASLQKHLNDGHKPDFASAFISTTADLAVAVKFAAPFQSIALIDLELFSRLGGLHHDLTTFASREHSFPDPDSSPLSSTSSTGSSGLPVAPTFSSDAAKRFAKRSSEVLLRGGALPSVPQSCVTIVDMSITACSRTVLQGSNTVFPESLEELTPADAVTNENLPRYSSNSGLMIVRSTTTGQLFSWKRAKPNVSGDQMCDWEELRRQVGSEFASFSMARALGLAVVDVAMYDFTVRWQLLGDVDGHASGRCLVLAGCVPGSDPPWWSEPLAGAGIQKLRSEFVRDALLGNWLLAGTRNNPNVEVLPDGTLLRVGMERCLGNKYEEDDWNPEKEQGVPYAATVKELIQMRSATTAKAQPLLSCLVDLSDADVRTQIRNLLGDSAAVAEVLQLAAHAPDLPTGDTQKAVLQARLQYLSQLAASTSHMLGAAFPCLSSMLISYTPQLEQERWPAARDGHSATALPWNSDSVLVFGGHGNRDEHFSDLWELNLDLGRWIRHLPAAGGSASRVPPRHSHTASRCGQFVVLFGGQAPRSKEGLLNDLHILDVRLEGQLSILKTVNPTGACPPPRCRHAACAFRLQRRAASEAAAAGMSIVLLVHGGWNRRRLSDLWRCTIDLPEDGSGTAVINWKQVFMPMERRAPAMHRHAMCLNSSGSLVHLLGNWGAAGGAYKRLWTMQTEQPERGFISRETLRRAADGPSGQSGHAFAHCSESNSLLVIGGGSMVRDPSRTDDNFGSGFRASVRTFSKISALQLETATWFTIYVDSSSPSQTGDCRRTGGQLAATSAAACLLPTGGHPSVVIMGGHTGSSRPGSGTPRRTNDVHVLRSQGQCLLLNGT